jgi:hypothetical protein
MGDPGTKHGAAEVAGTLHRKDLRKKQKGCHDQGANVVGGRVGPRQGFDIGSNSAEVVGWNGHVTGFSRAERLGFPSYGKSEATLGSVCL